MRLFALHPATLSLALLLAAASLPTWAADAAAFESATAVFTRASGGDTSAIEPAASQLLAMSQAEPQDTVLRAYAGAATAMRARTTWMPWKKMGHAEDGLAMIDKALALLTPADDAPRYRGVPASLETRFTAANTFVMLPSMFNRQVRGTALLDEVLKSPLFDPSPAGFKATVWLLAARQAGQANQPEQARQWLQKAATSGAPQAAAAQALLKDL